MRAVTVMVNSCRNCPYYAIISEECHCTWFEEKLDINERSVSERCLFPSVEEGEKE